jgi:hypothetical protein
VNISVQEIGFWVGTALASQIEMQTRTIRVAEWIVDQSLSNATSEIFLKVVDRLSNQQSGALEAIFTIARNLRTVEIPWIPRSNPVIVSWAIEADPLSTSEGLPFVDRTDFRSLLPRHGSALKTNCLVVAGGDRSGKSFLKDFCQAYAMSRGGIHVGYAKLNGSPARATPRAVAQSLAFGLKADPRARPHPHEEMERDAKNLASWLALTTPENDLPAIAILDGFNDPDLPESIHVFIGELAKLVASRETVRSRLCLILTGYDSSRLLRFEVDAPVHVLEPIDEEHLEEWFRLSFPDQPDYRYEQAAERIIADLQNCQQHERLETLNFEVFAASAAFRG